MTIYPAVDIKDGKCVRLRQGRFDDMTVYCDDPFTSAGTWKKAGAKYLHAVDLDGARTGVQENLHIVSKIANLLEIKVQMGGGFRTMEPIEEALKSGIYRVILGTAAVKDPALIKNAVERYGNRIAVGIDARDGMAAIDGWENTSGCPAMELALEMEKAGVETVIYTDISRDGMLIGPNFEAMRKMREATSMKVIASGGISKIDDIKKLKEIGMDGAIVGKALYTGDIDLAEALAAAGHGGGTDC